MTIVIGYGNPLRGDDGAGPAVGEAVGRSRPDVRVFTPHQLLPELAGPISEADAVVFVDASVEGVPGRIRVSRVESAPAGSLPTLHHVITPQGLLGLAHAAYGRAAEGWLLRIDGESFDAGATLSPPVRDAVIRATELTLALVGGQHDRDDAAVTP